MCVREYSALHDLYTKMKASIESLTQSPTASSLAPAPAIERPRDVPQTDSQTSNNLSYADLSWDIESSDPFYDKSHVSLCYALNTSSVLCSVEFDSTGSKLAFADGRSVFVVNTSDGSLIVSFDIPKTSPDIQTRALRFSLDGQFVAISGPSVIVHIFSIPERKLVQSLTGHSGGVWTLLFLSEQNWLLSGGADGMICIWEVGTWRLVRQLQHKVESKEDVVVSMTEAYDKSFVAVGFMNGSVGIYEPTFTQPMSKFHAHDAYLLGVVAAHNGPMIATCSHDRTVKLWSIGGVVSCKHTLQGHSDCVLTACFSPDDSIVFSGSKDETIKVWDQKSGQILFTISAYKNTQFKIDHHPVERMFVSCSGDGIVSVWKYDAKP